MKQDNSFSSNQFNRSHLTHLILLGLRHERYSTLGDTAYEIAKANFTPHQLGALHRAMSRCMKELDYLDMNR